MSAVKKLWCVRVTVLFRAILGLCDWLLGPIGRIAGIIAGVVIGRAIQKGYADKCLQYNCYVVAAGSGLISVLFMMSGHGEFCVEYLLSAATAVISAIMVQPRDGYEPEETEEEPEENSDGEYVLLSEEDAEIARELLEEMEQENEGDVKKL